MNRAHPCVGWIFLATSIALCGYFYYWLYSPSIDTKVHAAMTIYYDHSLKGNLPEGEKVVREAIDAEPEGPLHILWRPLVRVQRNGYEKFSYYIRLLQAEPNLEVTYLEISKLIEQAPGSFHRDVKQRYLSDISKIEGIQWNYLEKYHLVPD
ncbi:MAG: hypothetical protein ACWA5Q_03525 [bacterium]